MLAYRMKSIKKSCTDILKMFCDKNFTTLNRKLITRDGHSLPHSICLLDRGYIYSLGSKNLKYSSSVYRRLHCLTKSQVRWYSAQQNPGLPQLTSLPLFDGFPGLFTPFSNLFLTFLVIKPFVDGTFDLREFATASKMVVQVVSRKMASNDIDSLDEMMTTSAFNDIKQNLPSFSAEQRQELAVDQEDIYVSAISNMKFTNDRQNDKKLLEISMLYHVLRGYKNMNFEPFNPFQGMQNPQQQSQLGQNPLERMKGNTDKMYVLNYSFIREYSNGMASDWLLSGLNHYKKSQIAPQGFPF